MLDTEALVMSWRDKHTSTQRGRDEAERQLRQLERYIHDLPTPDQQAQTKTEISLCLVQLLAAVNRSAPGSCQSRSCWQLSIVQLLATVDEY